MTKLIERKAGKSQIALLGNSERTAFAVSIDGYVYGAGFDKMEALTAFRSLVARHGGAV